MQKLLKVSEAAAALSVSPSTIYRMIDEQRLTKVLIRNAIRVPASEVERINSPVPSKIYVAGSVRRAVGI